MNFLKKLVKKDDKKDANGQKTEGQVNDNTLKDMEKNLQKQQRNQQLKGIFNIMGDQLTE